MHHPHHAIVRAFIDGLNKGELPAALVAPGMTVWTPTSGVNPGEKYLYAIKLLQSLFPDGLQYELNSITAEDDRAVAEVHGQGTLSDGNAYQNDYVFLFQFRDGQIAHLKEHTNPEPVQTLIKPLLAAALGAP